MLALLTAAEHPHLPSKLVLIGSAVFDTDSPATIESRKRSRMDAQTRARFDHIRSEIETATGSKRVNFFRE